MTKKCPVCEEEIQDATVTCPHCGHLLSTPQARQDWLRVEACIRFGLERWGWVGSLALAVWAGWQWLHDTSDWVFAVFAVLVAIGAVASVRQRLQMKRDDERLAQKKPDASAMR
jgi:hypothetical protein